MVVAHPTTTAQSADRIRRSLRDSQIIEWVQQGLTHRQIGEKVGMSDAGVSAAIDRALRHIEKPVADAMRKVHMARLEFLWEQCMPAVILGDMSAIRTAVLVLKRQAVMLGIDAPVQVSIKRVVGEMQERYGLDEDEALQLFGDIQKDLDEARKGGAEELKVLSAPL